MLVVVRSQRGLVPSTPACSSALEANLAPRTSRQRRRRVARAISVPRAKVVVPSCNASGKTHLAARLALAFYDSFKPGTPCDICGGPCGGAKVITTSSKWDHLHDNLWGEIRMAYPQMV